MWIFIFIVALPCPHLGSPRLSAGVQEQKVEILGINRVVWFRNVYGHNSVSLTKLKRKNSIMQSSLLEAEQTFTTTFPGTSDSSVWLFTWFKTFFLNTRPIQTIQNQKLSHFYPCSFFIVMALNCETNSIYESGKDKCPKNYFNFNFKIPLTILHNVSKNLENNWFFYQCT